MLSCASHCITIHLVFGNDRRCIVASTQTFVQIKGSFEKVDKGILLPRNLAVNYLCFHAVFYPLLTHFLMSESETGGVGSAPVHALQLLALLACLVIGWSARATRPRRFDIWTIGIFYFTCASFLLAEFYAENEKLVEIAYAARFIMWFLFAAIITRGKLNLGQLTKLSASFLAGTFIQGMLAIWAFKTQSGTSIYNEVYATTGAANVSGKMIVAFVTLSLFLASYWFFTSQRFRWLYLVSLCVGMLVILFSYNRATQLSLTIVILLDGFWLFRNSNVKAVFLLAIIAFAVGGFLSSEFGEAFLLRWQNIHVDGGSGRVKLVRAALENFANPDSMNALLFGKGYHQTKLLMYQACGAYIGTHSDLLDFLTVYGLIGGCFYFWIAWKILTFGRGLPTRSLEYLCIRSCGVFIILTGLITGVFQGTYTFFMLFTICQYWFERGSLIEARRRQHGIVEPFGGFQFGYQPSPDDFGSSEFPPYPDEERDEPFGSAEDDYNESEFENPDRFGEDRKDLVDEDSFRFETGRPAPLVRLPERTDDNLESAIDRASTPTVSNASTLSVKGEKLDEDSSSQPKTDPVQERIRVLEEIYRQIQAEDQDAR